MITPDTLRKLLTDKPHLLVNLVNASREFAECVQIVENKATLDVPPSLVDQLADQTQERMSTAIGEVERQLLHYLPDLNDFRIFPHPFSDWHPNNHQAQRKGYHIFEFFSEQDPRFNGVFEAKNMLEAAQLLNIQVNETLKKYALTVAPDDIRFKGWDW